MPSWKNFIKNFIAKRIMKRMDEGKKVTNRVLTEGDRMRHMVQNDLASRRRYSAYEPSRPPPPPRPPRARSINQIVTEGLADFSNLPVGSITSTFIHNKETDVTLPSAPAKGALVTVLCDERPISVRAANPISGVNEPMIIGPPTQVLSFIFDGEQWMPLSYGDIEHNPAYIAKLPEQVYCLDDNDDNDDNDEECYNYRLGL